MLSPRFARWCSLVLLAGLGGCHDREGVEAQSRALSAGFQVGAAQSFGTAATGRAYTEQAYPSVAYGGGVFLSVWCSVDNGRLYAVRTRASDGVVLDDRRILLSRVTFTTPVAVDWDGQNFLVVWPDYQIPGSIYNLLGMRVGTDGKLVDPAPVVMRADAEVNQVAMAHGTSEHLIVWREAVPRYSQQYDVLGARFGHDGKMLGSIIQLGVLPTAEATPAVAFDGTNYLVAWEDRRGPVPLIYGNRVRASDGALLDGTNGFQIGSSFSSVGPAVAFDGTNWLVAFQINGIALGGVRLRASDRTAIDTTDLPLVSILSSAGMLKPPRLVFDGAHYLLSWRQLAGSLGLRHQAARIDPATGANLDGAGVNIATSLTSVDDRNGHQVAAGSGRLYAAYTQQDIFKQDVHAMMAIDIKGVFINPATGTLDGASAQLSRSAHWQEATDASSDGQHHLVVWQEYNGTRFEIRGARVSNQDGTVLEPAGFTIGSSATADQFMPRTASNGSNHLVVWWDGTSLRANRVRASDGALLDGGGTVLPAQPGAWSWESPRYQVASDGTDYLVFWTAGSDYNGPGKAVRVRGSDGALLDATPRDAGSSTASRYYARLAYSGTRYVALWLESGAGGTYQLKAVRLATDATLLDATPIVVASVSGFAKDPRMAGDGENMLVTWTDISRLKGRRLRLSDGMVLDAADLALNDKVGGEQAALAFDGSGFVSSWVGSVTPGISQVVAVRISRAGTVLDTPPTIVSSLPNGGWQGLALAAGADGKVLATYTVYDDAADMQTQRIRARLLGDPPPPPDAAPPSPDVAPDVALPPDAGVPPDAAAPPPPLPDAAALPPDVAAPPDYGAPPPDAATPPDTASPPPDAALPVDLALPPPDAALPVDLAADQSTTPDAAVAADSAPAADGAVALDAAGPPGDGSAPADVKAAPDSAVYATDGPASDALARDAAVEKPTGGHGGLGCQMAVSGSSPVAALLLLVPLLLRRRRVRSFRNARGSVG
jgi:hypothetical protein